MLALIATLVLAQELTEKTFERVRDEILPSKEDLKWLDIPWQPTLWDGIVAAQKEEKPVLFFAMNGTPLGCV